MELQDALDTLAKLVEDSPITHAEPANALQLVKAELDSMQHRLAAYEREEKRHKAERVIHEHREKGLMLGYENAISMLADRLAS